MASPKEDEDPVPALTERARETLGPLVDAWSDRIRTEIDSSGSLDAFRDRLDALNAWLDSPREPVPDVENVVDAFGPALVTAHLAGRFDVEETPVELASAAAEHARLPFAEQIEFFRSKLNLPSETWTDIVHDEHDRAFVVAGAAHADLVSDLRDAVDQAIAEGTTLATFRRDFDSVVAKHGWSYKGGRTWRTEVIYGTNVRTSYAAGRYRQMKEGVDRRPYWRYRHSHASENPREEHLAWDGTVLRHDDPWWNTHYGPNGWGCKCYVEALSDRDLKRLGKTGPDQAPPVNLREETIGKTGPNPRTVLVPEGVDPGWGYAPGQSVVDNKPAPADPFAIGEISREDIGAQVGRQRGSNPGGLYEGTDGARRYVKWYEDPGQAYGEAVANRAYRELGIDAPVSSLVRDGERIVGIANDIIDHSGTLGAAKRLPKGRSKEVLKGFSADVWLANWDAVGLDLDNIVATRTTWKSVARIDQGGALLMRARRGRKPHERLEQISEWDGFTSGTRNPAYARVFRAAGYESADELGRQAIRQIENIEALGKRTEGFKRLAPAVDGVAEADQAAIREVLAKRAALLKSQVVPRVRASMRAAKDPSAHQARTRSGMGGWYDRALSGGKRKVAAGAPRHDMTDPELATTYAYTTEEAVWSHYRKLNQELRDAFEGQRAPPKRIEDYALTLNDALDRLPDQAGRFWRNVQMSAAEQAAYSPGSIHTWAAFSSASTRQDVFGSRNTRFVIRGRHGKDIRRYSAYPREDEVIFKAGTRVRVVGRREGRKTYIEVEEVGDD